MYEEVWKRYMYLYDGGTPVRWLRIRLRFEIWRVKTHTRLSSKWLLFRLRFEIWKMETFHLFKKPLS